jgi:hypothetical protein
MKRMISILLIVPALCPALLAQGNFVYDQQSATESTPSETSGLITPNQPLGQSFTPGLSSVGFVRFELHDLNAGNSLGATLFVNLRSDSITGPILGASAMVFMPDSFSGYADFIFSAAISINPGTTYFFQPVVQSGDQWLIGAHPPGNYPGGSIFVQGAPNTGSDLWFREGIVPEPSSAALALLGGVLVWLRPRSRKS